MTYPHHEFDHEPTAQEVFDVSVQHLLNQEARCTHLRTGTCVYRSLDGKNACAVGHFIPDGSPALDTPDGVHTLISKEVEGVPSWFKEHASLLSALQDQHDGGAFDDRAPSLRRLADAYKLNYWDLSPERMQFLRDTLELQSSAWLRHVGGGRFVEYDENGKLHPCSLAAITLFDIHNALNRIVAGETRIPTTNNTWQHIANAHANNDAAYLDPYIADVILQIALFGEVVYG